VLPESAPLPAGNFSDWLRDMRRALAGGPGMDVACGDCVGCCTSSYFIKLRPADAAALQRIPRQHLAESPGEPGTMLMGYDAAGHCPMFDGRGCSIYSQRPETCRIYDCRIFTATGMQAGEERTVINRRVARWRFEYPGETDRDEQRAVKAAAAFLRQHPVRFPNGKVPSRPGDIAVLAVKSYAVFMGNDPAHADAVSGIIAACRDFDARA
jgi:Fe-S-cluster containining protein